MTRFDERVKELLAKHPDLTEPEAVKIVTEKNARKKKKRSEKRERSNAKRLKYEANLLERQ